MKIRMGFVSNSSSSSFCVWGVATTLEKAMKMFGVKPVPQGEDPEDDEDLDICETSEELYDACKKCGLDFVAFGDCDREYFVGLNLRYVSVKNAKGFGDKLIDTEKKLKKYFPGDLPRIHEGSESQ